MSPHTILCVDDEPRILRSLACVLSAPDLRILSADGGEDALAVLATQPVDVLISDAHMPGMGRVPLMQTVRDRWPGITRLTLTAHADLSATIAAINEGQVHRYLTKPWHDAELVFTVRDALRQRFLEQERERLEKVTRQQNEALRQLNAHLEELVAERTQALAVAHEHLRKNYFHSIKTFSSVLEMRAGRLMGHARRVADLSLRIAKAMQGDEAFCNDVLIAALLHDIGHIGHSDGLLQKPCTHLAGAEAREYRQHALFGEQALMCQEDMQVAAAMIRSHHERHDGDGYPDGLAGEAIPLGARILAVADAYDDLCAGHIVSKHLTEDEACAVMARGRGSQFDPAVLDVMLNLLAHDRPSGPQPAVLMRTTELTPGMVIARDFLSPQGALLLAADHVLSADVIGRIRRLERESGRPMLLATRAALASTALNETP